MINICILQASSHNDDGEHESAKRFGQLALRCDVCVIVYYIFTVIVTVVIVVLIVTGPGTDPAPGPVCYLTCTYDDNYNYICHKVCP